MEIIEQLAKGLGNSPASWMLAIVLVVAGYLYREKSQLQKEFIATVLKQESDHRETLMKIAPLAEKLTESVEILERITNNLLQKD